jgi:hypothetical protein
MNVAAGDLLAMLAKIPDTRERQGRRHPLQAIMAATICALLSGVRSFHAMAEWVRLQEPKFWHWLRFTRRPPCGNTYRDALAQVPAEVLEKIIRDWVTAILGVVPENDLQAVAIDGKTLCGTLQPHQAAIHLLAVLDHKTKCVLSQQAVDSKTNEHKAALTLLKTIALKGRVVTGDAMFCQREVCRQVIDDGGDYLFIVKDNQPSLKAAIAAEFQPGFSPLD